MSSITDTNPAAYLFTFLLSKPIVKLAKTALNTLITPPPLALILSKKKVEEWGRHFVQTKIRETATKSTCL